MYVGVTEVTVLSGCSQWFRDILCDSARGSEGLGLEHNGGTLLPVLMPYNISSAQDFSS